MTDDLTFEDGDHEDIFTIGDVFVDRKLVRVGHIPKRDRIIGREDEIQFLGTSLAPAINGEPPVNVTIHGKTGTGKSLVSRYVSELAVHRAASNDVNILHVYIECSELSSDTDGIREMALQVREQLDEDGISVPSSGISKKEYLKRLWEMCEVHDIESIIVILDEIDKLDGGSASKDYDDDLLMTLSRAEEKRQTDTHVSIISVSNKIAWRQGVDSRVDSSLSDRKIIFDPYNADELRDILAARKDAFRDGTLDDSVIPRIAALSAREHGDARKAVDMLRHAGEIAERSNDDSVTEKHLDEAKLCAEADQFTELIAGSTPHAKYVLRALASITKSDAVAPNEGTGGYSKREIFNVYQQICEDEGVEPFKWDSVSRILKEQAFLGITESHYTGDGRGQGSYKTHELIRDPDVVLRALGS